MKKNAMHNYWMEQALNEAKRGALEGEIPIGAVLVGKGGIIAQAHNQKESLNDPTAHAEILVIREASEKLGTWRLTETTLYVTAEPCVMCAGAIIQARIPKIVYGCR